MSRARDFDHVPLDHTVPWRLGLPLPETFDQYDDYGALTGWVAES